MHIFLLLQLSFCNFEFPLDPPLITLQILVIIKEQIKISSDCIFSFFLTWLPSFSSIRFFIKENINDLLRTVTQVCAGDKICFSYMMSENEMSIPKNDFLKNEKFSINRYKIFLTLFLDDLNEMLDVTYNSTIKIARK